MSVPVVLLTLSIPLTPPSLFQALSLFSLLWQVQHLRLMRQVIWGKVLKGLGEGGSALIEHMSSQGAG